MYRFVEMHRPVDCVEPICHVLGIAPSCYFEARAQAQDPSRRARAPNLSSGPVRGAQVRRYATPHRSSTVSAVSQMAIAINVEE